jgi:hypothetical protein
MVGTLVDRPALARTPGLRRGHLLGSGRGADMGLGADLRRWACFATWDDEADLDRFLAASPLARRWADGAEESYLVRLAPLGGHGTWGGVPALPGRPVGGGDGPDPAADGPVAVLTRATVAPRHWVAFHRAARGVDAELRVAPGLLATVGIGEWPVGLLATFSLWRRPADVAAFARRPGSSHADVIARTRRDGWFREELFARFRPYASAGTWDGADPLDRVGNGS